MDNSGEKIAKIDFIINEIKQLRKEMNEMRISMSDDRNRTDKRYEGEQGEYFEYFLSAIGLRSLQQPKNRRNSVEMQTKCALEDEFWKYIREGEVQNVRTIKEESGVFIFILLMTAGYWYD